MAPELRPAAAADGHSDGRMLASPGCPSRRRPTFLDAPDVRPEAVDRHLPVIRPVGAERFTGILGVRRPGDWTGRLGPIPETEPVNDEAFVKAWGSLPEESLTLSGTSRFSRELAALLHTGPAPPAW